jgi:voltage-gated potassium channel
MPVTAWLTVNLRRQLRLSFVLIISVLAIGTTGFHVIEGWAWFDGFYMTLITMTTIGYGETYPLSFEGRVFNVFLLLGAVMSGGFLIGTFTQAMLEFELKNVLGRRRMERELANLKDHYIVCGAGRVGRTVVHELRDRKVPCVVVERDAERADWATKEGVPVVVGSASSEGVLLQARIGHAKGLVAAVTSDADNLYIVLTASGMAPDLKIIARSSDEEAIPKLLRAGASQVLSPYHFIGQRIAQLLLRPNVLDFIDTAFGTERIDIRIEEIRLPESTPLGGLTMAQADIRQKTGALILALKKNGGELDFNPAPSLILQAGDYLIAIGSAENLQRLEKFVGV